jgi:predicted site-specific integrase-resolvase
MKELMSVLTPAELAKRWGLSVHTLLLWRIQGNGPKFLKLGRKVLYSFDEIEKFEKQQTKRSTVG